MWHAYLRQEENSNIQILTSDKMYRFWFKAVLGKSGCCEEECTQIIIPGPDKALYFVLP
jgi:hypothetical protein